jgi:excisionase family DNA binding protein
MEEILMACITTEALVGDGLLTVSEAIAFMRLSRSTLYTLMDEGELAYVRIGRARRIPKRALIDLAMAHLNGDSSS